MPLNFPKSVDQNNDHVWDLTFVWQQTYVCLPSCQGAREEVKNISRVAIFRRNNNRSLYGGNWGGGNRWRLLLFWATRQSPIDRQRGDGTPI